MLQTLSGMIMWVIMRKGMQCLKQKLNCGGRRKQRKQSKSKWVTEGDRNTKYFHALASKRRKLNKLVSLKVNNQQTDDPPVIRKEVFKHFQKVYCDRKTFKLMDLNCGIQKLSNEAVVELEASFSKEV